MLRGKNFRCLNLAVRIGDATENLAQLARISPVDERRCHRGYCLDVL
jgi:hypothetical protein